MAFARRTMRCSSSPSLTIFTRSARSAALRKLRFVFTRRVESIPLIRSNDFRKGAESRYTIVRCRDRSDERRLACCAAPAAAGPGAAEIGDVHLDVAFQAFARVTLQHDLSELVLHHPSSRLGDAKASTEFDTGNALL